MTKTFKPMRILVTGGRLETLTKMGLDHGAVYALVVKTLNVLSAQGRRKVTIIHGGADGVDRFANEWALNTKAERAVYPVSQDDWKRYGGVAGNMRNTEMLKKGMPDVVIGFPGGGGTKDMISKAKEAGKRFTEVTL